jgi:amidohydrolase
MSQTHPLVAAIAPDVPELVAIRRDIHAHPELGLEEHRTAALVSEKLKAWGIEHVTGVGKTGVVATIKGTKPGNRSIGLRCDMDALPIVEATGLPYASKTPGRMHACGHDGHTTMLLGAAKHLAENRDFAGTVQLIFQPAEEGRGGAMAMLDDKLFERFPCDAVYGMHNRPGLEVGKFSIKKGALLAGGCMWTVTFRGKGGHGGSTPHLTQDLTVVLAHFILGLQTIVGRNISPLEPAVISVGAIQGGDLAAGNVIASEIKVTGTARYFARDVKGILDTRLRTLAEQFASLHGATAEVHMDWVATPTINHDDQTDVCVSAASSIVSAADVDPKMPASTGGEDFAFMLEKVPGAMIMIGNGIPADGVVHQVHTPKYDFNDEIIPYGVAYWVELVNTELRPQPY